MKLIYLCHKFGGDPKNTEALGEKFQKLLEACPQNYYFSPHHATGFLYHEMTRRQGMDYCLEALGRCDAMYVFGKDSMSEGCMEEKAFCKKKGIPIYTCKISDEPLCIAIETFKDGGKI